MLPHIEIKIVDGEGKAVPRGETGEFCTRGYSVMKGYWNDAEKTAEIAHHHAEAVVERHGDAQPVIGRELQTLGDEIAVVQDVVMAERRALGMASGP